ncbi:GTPase-associated protein 1-related protein [Streptomyces sp. NRRL B-3229]|uniref:GTPase-associated protein 1-related protein n=1 Tax=Streptomyces sp. NRRL B-3229 TaxID=1463836 RepID=UPI000692329D|nr:GTPase-associated protein 1-related protein [Streptomyces sp. NRRL B-3229]
MGLQQMYYTSCERGLTGYAGYQFNAVSDGVSAETLREVEALVAYEPPQSLVYSDDPADLERCPVNLCFVPGRPGESAVTACVRYVGRDPSQRFGNYFAHALGHPDVTGEADALLPIELWDSPEWASRPVADIRLPELPAPPRPGPLSPAGVDRFLRGHPYADRLPRLVSAVLSALTEDRTVLVIDSSSEAVAHWFAAVCYLLPPPLARTLSFATYLSRPERSRLRLVGTVPEIRVGLGPDTQDAFHVFDLVSGRTPDIPEHPLAGLLARVGVPTAQTFWSWTNDYVSGREHDPQDWYAPAVAAAVSGGTALDDAEVASLVGWLDTCDHLPPDVLAAVVRDLYRQRKLSADQLTALSRIARATHDTELVEQIQGEQLETEMRRHLADDPTAAEPVPIRDPVLRRQATARFVDLLRDCDDRQGVRLLLWASAARLEPEHDTLVHKSAEITRALLDRTVTARVDERFRAGLTQVAARWPGFREGMVLALSDQLAEQPHHFPELLRGLPGELLREGDLADHPALREHHLIARAGLEPERTAHSLVRVLMLREPPLLDSELLRKLWPSGRWTHEEALEVVSMLPSSVQVDESAAKWLETVFARDIHDHDELVLCLELCTLMTSPDRLSWLPRETRECVRSAVRVAELLARPRASGLLHVAQSQWPPLWQPVIALRRTRLPRALLECPGTPREISLVLLEMGDRTTSDYLHLVCRAAAAPTPVSRRNILAAVAAQRSVSTSQKELVEQALEIVEREWKPADLDLLANEVRPLDRSLAERLARRAEQKRARWYKPKRARKREPGAGTPDADKPESPPPGVGG